MDKLKLGCGALIVLVLTLGFSSFFALTALTRLYAESLGAPDSSAGLEALLVQTETSAFIDEQLYIALAILLASSLALLAMVAWRAPSVPEQWSMQNVGWHCS